jgi:hypothetical protein
MDSELQQRVVEYLKNTYPALFDDNSVEKQLDGLTKQAYIYCKDLTKDSDILITLISLYTAYLIKANQESEGTATSVKADVLQVQYSANNQGSGYFLKQFQALASKLGANQWEVNIF